MYREKLDYTPLPKSPETSEVLDFGVIRDELRLQLCLYVNETSKDIWGMLCQEADPFDEDECIEKIQTSLDAQLAEQAETAKNTCITEVRASFPNTEEAKPLETPKRYLKKNSLDGSYRPQLRQAHAACLARSKSRLITTLAEDDSHTLLDHGIDKETIRESVREYRRELASTVESTIHEMKRLLPATPVPPDSLEALRLRLWGFDGTHTVLPPETEEDRRALRATDNKLKSALSNYLSSDYVAARISATYTEGLAAYAKTMLRPHYLALAAAEIETLSAEIIEAYDKTAQSGIAYQPPQTGSMDTSAKADVQTATTVPHTPETTQPPENEVLGHIAGIFPWAPEKAVEILLTQEGDNIIVYCKALSPAAEDTSRLVRSKRLTSGSTFDRMWEQVRSIELTNPNGTHPNINKVDRITQTGLDEVATLGYGNNAPNAKRIYYAKTTCAKYGAIQELAAAHNLPADTVLLILVAETDKANQLKTYSQFGIRRAVARNANVGSI